MPKPVKDMAAPCRPGSLLRGVLRVALFLCFAAWATPGLAQCTCSLPADQTCPSACGSCLAQPVSCMCATPCTFNDAVCSPGYAEISQSGVGCSLFFVSAVCQRTGSVLTSQCATCAPGRWGSTCIDCPGGAATPCNLHGTCDQGITGSGACACSTGFAGTACNTCAAGYFGYPNCKFCNAATTCNGHGTCSATGDCACDTGFAGAACDGCAPGYFGYPTCKFCSAATTCSGHGTCSATGDCACDTGFAGAACDTCAPGYFGYPTCKFCNAATTCSGHGTCSATGDCACSTGFTGTACDSCAPGYFGYPTCRFCNAATTCSGHGFCGANGFCVCDPGYGGASCLACNGVTVEAVCNDGIDDDCDNLTDCADTDCCTAGACASGDHDGDGFAGCDCDDANAGAWATPGEVRDLLLDASSGTPLTWSPPLQPGGNPLLYETLRFDDPRDFDGVGVCILPANPKLTSNKDPQVPLIGRAYFYLVRATDACPLGEGPLGASSSGDPRTGTCH